MFKYWAIKYMFKLLCWSPCDVSVGVYDWTDPFEQMCADVERDEDLKERPYQVCNPAFICDSHSPRGCEAQANRPDCHTRASPILACFYSVSSERRGWRRKSDENGASEAALLCMSSTHRAAPSMTLRPQVCASVRSLVSKVAPSALSCNNLFLCVIALGRTLRTLAAETTLLSCVLTVITEVSKDPRSDLMFTPVE